ncbi:hypothetical protein RND81_07G045500 [Saponaria officinalis]|uniref:ARM repeat superfamily protein n=1 Tax=Saponaria officinalis TaxID=3572 RepID=A0AAW1JME3_SAPOF
MVTIPVNNFIFQFNQISEKSVLLNPRGRRNYSCNFHTHNHHLRLFNPRKCFYRLFLCRVSGDADSGAQHSTLSDVNSEFTSLSSSSETYVPVLVRMLGLENDIRDREQAVIALWKYSLGGKHYVGNIMKFRGCVNLVVNLLKSESTSSCEAAAGLLRMVSSVNSYRDVVAESGAIEETAALLRRLTLTSEVKEQSLCMLWNLSSDEKLGLKIANPSLLPVLVKCLDDEDMKIIEAAGGVLANLALNTSNHMILVEANVIPKLAKFLTCETDVSKVIKKEARNALLELAKDNYYKVLIMEEGLVLVPLVGAAAYLSFRPALHSWPSLPDGTELRRSSRGSSRYGASELLIGLNVEENTDNIDKLKMDAIVGRTQQQFLARIGAIENGDEKNSSGPSSTSNHHTLLPWRDGIARLVLILELEDEIAIARAADAIAAASINETIRLSFKEAGAVQRLIYLLRHNSRAVQSAVVNALEKLSASNRLCETMEMEGVTQILVDMIKDSDTSGTLMEKTLSILARILDPKKQMMFKFYYGHVNGSQKSTASGGENDASVSGGRMEDMKNMLDSALVSRLASILRTGSSCLQAEVASILEFVTTIEPCMDVVVGTHVESGLLAVFEQNIPKDMEGDAVSDPDPAFLEETGLAISAASRLLTKLVDNPEFLNSIDLDQFTKLLRQILKSEIPLHYKDWVAACLVRLSLFSSPFESSINTEVTLYETIPRLIEQIKTSSADGQEAAVVQLNRIIAEGVEGASQSIASHGGIFPVVKAIEEGSDTVIEAGMAILYNLSMDSENHSAILAAGAVPLLTRMVRSDTPHSMRALRLLRNLPV